MSSSNSVKDYALLSTLASGSFAKVELALHLPTRCMVAIKIIVKTKTNAQAIKREVEIMKKLNHPFIIKLYNVLDSEYSINLIMEYAANGAFIDYLEKHGRMAELPAKRVFLQLVAAVKYCHRQKIVHRDLKLENMLLDKHMNIKIADFGLSNFYNPSSYLKTICGSRNYAAPELFLGRTYVGPELDVWALGVILYNIICGKMPFHGDTLIELRTRIMSRDYLLPSYLSLESKDLVRKLFTLNPTKRISLNAVIFHKWFNLKVDEAAKLCLANENNWEIVQICEKFSKEVPTTQ